MQPDARMDSADSAQTGEKSRKYMVPAILKCFDIVEFVAENQRVTLVAICRGLGLPKTSVYQILNTLCERGYLLYSPVDGTYCLSLRFFSLGNRALLNVDIRLEAQPLLYELMMEARQTCHLGILEGHEAIYLAKAFYEGSAVVNSWVGKRLNLQTTAMGRVLLAWRPAAEALELLRRNPPGQLTPNTVADPQEYLRGLAQVRQRGWAEENGENRVGIRCVAAPVRDVTGQVVAAVGISGLAAEITDDALPPLSEKLCQAADKLSQRLGHRQAAL